MKYTVNHKGATIGAVTGKSISYSKDEVVECEKDDLKHLGDAATEVKEPSKKKEAKKK